MSILKKSLGLFTLTFYGIGIILGGGIYSLVGTVAGIAGESVWISFIIAAIAASLTALSYAELSAMYPKAGAEFIFFRNAFPKHQIISNIMGLVMIFAGVVASSTVSLAFAGYFQSIVSMSPLIVSCLVLSLFTLINIVGAKESGWFNVIFTLIEIIGLLVFIYFGVQRTDFANSIAAPINVNTFSGAALIIFSYLGFESLVNFSEETKSPERTVPRALFLSLSIVTIIYVFVALSALSLLSVKELSQSLAPIADAVRFQSEKTASILSIIALFATGNTVLITLASTSRITFSMGREGVFPEVLSHVTKVGQTPWVAALLVLILNFLMIQLGSIELLASLTSFFTMLAFVLIHVALIYLRVRKPELARPFRIPVSLFNIPIAPLLGLSVIVFLLMQFDFKVYKLSGITLLIIFVLEICLSKLMKKRDIHVE